MLSVLIADDEQMICQMIRKMIDWESKGLSVAGTAENGIEVLERIGELHPDIVITDIRMPGIDGIEMISEAMKRNEKTDFVIISGYKSFDYAHQALKLGVRHYLLKPIDQKELSEALDDIIARRRKSEENAARTEELKEGRETLKRNSRQRFLNSILRGSSISAAEKEISEENLMEFRNDRYLAIFFKVDWTEEGEIVPGLLEILRTVIERQEAEWGCEFVNSQVRSGIISILNYPPGAKEAHPDDMEQLFTKCRKETDKFSGYSVTIGVGSEKGSIAGASETINEAADAVKCRIRKGIDRVIFYENLNYHRIPQEQFFSMEERSGTRKALEALDYEAVMSDFDQAAERILDDVRHSPLDIFELIGLFTEMICTELRKNGVNEEMIREFSLKTDQLTDHSTNETRMIQLYRESAGAAIRKVIAERNQRGQAPVREAKAYMGRHFAGNLTLEEVAEAAGISPAYLSTLFKKEVGIGFSEYLSQLRCEEAKRLLRESDESMTVIAEEVGYQDTKYFSRIFRKTVGLKPSEYRRLYR